MKIIINFDPATPDQIKYIEILANDLLFDRKRRNAHISSIVGHTISFLDDLTKSEASVVIEQFKEWKEQECQH